MAGDSQAPKAVTEGNYSAYAPDAPGCVATGETVEETLKRMHEALESHFMGMAEDGEPIPGPVTLVGCIEVRLPEPAAAHQRAAAASAWAG